MTLSNPQSTKYLSDMFFADLNKIAPLLSWSQILLDDVYSLIGASGSRVAELGHPHLTLHAWESCMRKHTDHVVRALALGEGRCLPRYIGPVVPLVDLHSVNLDSLQDHVVEHAPRDVRGVDLNEREALPPKQGSRKRRGNTEALIQARFSAW